MVELKALELLLSTLIGEAAAKQHGDLGILISRSLHKAKQREFLFPFHVIYT